jgi:hypothetical protein
MTPDDVDDLEAFFALILRKCRRLALTPPPEPDPLTGNVATPRPA